MARGRLATLGDSAGGATIDESGVDYSLLEDYGSNFTEYSGFIDPNCLLTQEDYFSHPKIVAKHYIRLGVYPVLLLQGILGNALAIPALVSLGRSAWSTLLYLAVLGLTDLIMLLARCGNFWYEEEMKDSLTMAIINSSDAACRTYTFAFLFVTHLSPWLMVAAAVEMTIASRWPHRAHEACTVERARYVLLLLTLILACLDINHFWTYGVPNRHAGCRYVEGFSEVFRDWVWPALSNAVLNILPLLVVGVCLSISVISLLQRTPRRHEEVRAHMSKYFLELPALVDFRAIVLVLSIIFLVLVIYQTTYSIITFLYTKEFLFNSEDCKTNNEVAFTLDFMETLANTLSFTFYSCKIYLYVGLSPAFRARLALGFRTAWRILARPIRKRSCSCLGGRPRWTLVARDDDSTGNRPDRAKEKQPDPESQTTLPINYPEFTASEGFTDNRNRTFGDTQTSCICDNNHHQAEIVVGVRPPQPFTYGFPDSAGDSGRNGAAVRQRVDPPTISSKPQRNRPNRQALDLGRGKEHTVIALNPSIPGSAGPSQGEGRPLSVSFGDHLV